MRVLLFIDSLVGAGAQRQLVNLALGLDARGHEVTIATYAPKDFFLSRLAGSGVAYLNYGKSFRFDLAPAWRLLRSVDALRPHVAVAFLRTPCVYAELVKVLRPSLPLIVSERAGVETRGLSRSDAFAGLLHRLATRVTANSHSYLDALLDVHPALTPRASVIYNGIDEAFLDAGRRRLGPTGTERYTGAHVGTRAHADGDVGGPLRLCVVAARANRQKAPLVMARAVAELRARNVVPFTLDWVGPVDFDSPLVRRTVREIESRGLADVWRWAGPCDSVLELYPGYDALVSSSLYEGVANTMCEAMASGLPVVVTDIADNARILEPGDAGLVCRPDDPGALADALERLLAMPRSERRAMGRRSHERARELFAMPRFVDRWERLCTDVARPDLT